ncbi:MAG TPA: sortase [Patescibacteria group bacterium]|nr:sortase [Patescibacteria group bacterium]
MNPQSNANHHPSDDYLVSGQKPKAHVQPLHDPRDEPNDSQLAAKLIREKLDTLYAKEPNAKAEVVEVLEATKPRSKHQTFMFNLQNSGQPMEEIQHQWHEYYTHLPEKEQHEVWNEFYASQGKTPLAVVQPTQAAKPEPEFKIAPMQPIRTKSHTTKRPTAHSVADVKKQLLGKSNRSGKLKARQHLKSLVFGLSMGAVVVLILLFGFFNERFIAPFISPSRHVSSTPIIVDPGTAVSPNPEVVIPKINVEIPVVYDEPSIADNAVETALERGVVHYATTPYPGQEGNVVIFGHSSNNILNPGKYKFAFVLLSRMDVGDTFYLTKDGKQYVYQVYKKNIVKPTDVGVMGPTDKPDTATLITCDPPGTSINRLVVVGQQVSPSPTANVASTATPANAQPAIIPSNAPSLWQRIKNWL